MDCGNLNVWITLLEKRNTRPENEIENVYYHLDKMYLYTNYLAIVQLYFFL